MTRLRHRLQRKQENGDGRAKETPPRAMKGRCYRPRVSLTIEERSDSVSVVNVVTWSPDLGSPGLGRSPWPLLIHGARARASKRWQRRAIDNGEGEKPKCSQVAQHRSHAVSQRRWGILYEGFQHERNISTLLDNCENSLRASRSYALVRTQRNEGSCRAGKSRETLGVRRK